MSETASLKILGRFFAFARNSSRTRVSSSRIKNYDGLEFSAKPFAKRSHHWNLYDRLLMLRKKQSRFRCYSKNFIPSSGQLISSVSMTAAIAHNCIPYNTEDCRNVAAMFCMGYDWLPLDLNYSSYLRRGVSPREKIMFLTTAPLLDFSPEPHLDRSTKHFILHNVRRINIARASFRIISQNLYREISAMTYRENYEKICNSD